MVSRFFQHRLPSVSALTLGASVLCVVALLSIPRAFAAAGINPSINYQGKLTTSAGASLANGQYNMRFKIFTDATGGSPVWTETWNESSQRVTATGGLFTAALGSITTMVGAVDFNNDSLYLQLEFDPGNDGTYEEVFAPRRRFSAVPYAHNARLLGGLTASQFLRADTMNATMSGDIIEGNQVIANTRFSGSQITIMRGSPSYFLGKVGFGTGAGLSAQTTVYTDDAANSEALLINSDETTGSQNLFKIISDAASANNAVFRIQADGATFSDNAYSSSGADYAEWFKSDDVLVPGEVVCIDIFQNNAVSRCERSGDPNVMGIVSTNPAFIGNTMSGADGLPIPGHYLIGLIGQVPTKISLENGPISSGDSLTSSSTAGVARKAKAGESTVGVALEAYDGTQETSVINVLISRRNQSLTVETVEENVLASIAAMNITDEVQKMVKTTIDNADLDTRISTLLTAQISDTHFAARVEEKVSTYLAGTGRLLIASQMEPLDQRLVALIGTSALISARINSLEDVLANMQSSLSVLSAFSGSTLRVASLQAESGAMQSLSTGYLRVAGRADIGAFSASGSLVQIGSLSATGALNIIGDVTVTGFVTIEKDLRVRGELILSNKQAGYALIPQTGTSVVVQFPEPMVATPIVTATPESPVLYAVRAVSATGFTIRIAGRAEEDIRFSYIALSAEEPRTVYGTGSMSSSFGIHPFPVNEKGQPLSTNNVWNSCIRGTPMMLGGEPVNCSRYHDDGVWEHPDLHISFVYQPNHEPPILTLPQGYVKSVVSDAPSETGDPVEPLHAAPTEDVSSAGETEEQAPSANETAAQTTEQSSPAEETSSIESDTLKSVPSTDDASTNEESPSVEQVPSTEEGTSMSSTEQQSVIAPEVTPLSTSIDALLPSDAVQSISILE